MNSITSKCVYIELKAYFDIVEANRQRKVQAMKNINPEELKLIKTIKSQVLEEKNKKKLKKELEREKVNILILITLFKFKYLF